MPVIQLLILLAVIDTSFEKNGPFTPEDRQDEIVNRYPDFCG